MILSIIYFLFIRIIVCNLLFPVNGIPMEHVYHKIEEHVYYCNWRVIEIEMSIMMTFTEFLSWLLIVIQWLPSFASYTLCQDLRTCFLAKLKFDLPSQTMMIQHRWTFSLHTITCKDVSLTATSPLGDNKVLRNLLVGCTARFQIEQYSGNLNLAFKVQDSVLQFPKESLLELNVCKMHFVHFGIPKPIMSARSSIRVLLNQVEKEIHIELCETFTHYLYYHKAEFLYDLQDSIYYLPSNHTVGEGNNPTSPLSLSKRLACENIRKVNITTWNYNTSLDSTLSFADKYRPMWTNLNCTNYFQIHNATNASIVRHQDQSLSDIEWCKHYYYTYNFKPMVSWRLMPEALHAPWYDKQCNSIIAWQLLEWAPKPSCWHLGWSHLNNASLPLIAILAASSSRHIRNPSTKTIALFFHLLPSLVQTIDCGFRYEFVLGYDEGDSFYDTEVGREEVKEWFRKYISTPLEGNSINMALRMVRVRNKIQKPGPVFQEMGRVAYEDGAEYFYRVNDDTELVSKHWPTIFVTTLKSLTVPYGVVGPYCREGNFPVLTHDFTHRSHLEIFGMNYYPPLLVDWWLDDWISFVYGQNRTFRASMVRIIHHVNTHGQRYEVDRGNEQYFLPYLKSERMKIREYMVSHLSSNESMEIVEKFDRDNTTAYYKILDIPNSVQDNLREILGEKEWSALLQQGF